MTQEHITGSEFWVEKRKTNKQKDTTPSILPKCLGLEPLIFCSLYKTLIIIVYLEAHKIRKLWGNPNLIIL